MSPTSFKNTLKAARAEADVAWHQFLLRYRPDADVHCFFEGLDDEAFYYPHLIEALSGLGEIHAYRCRGKTGVLRALDKAGKRFAQVENSRSLFFVDRDLDDFLGNTHPNVVCLYVTDGYSIENYLVHRDVLRVVWVTVLHLADLGSAWAVVSRRFDGEYKRFALHVMPVMAWALANRASGREIELNSVRLDHIVTVIDGMKVRRKMGRAQVLKHLDSHSRLSPATHRSRAAEWRVKLEGVPVDSWLRGKFAIWFLAQFLVRARQYADRRRPLGRASVKVQKNLTQATLVADLAAQLPPPSSLAKFLAQRGARLRTSSQAS